MEYLFLRRKKTRYTSVRQKTLLYRAASRRWEKEFALRTDVRRIDALIYKGILYLMEVRQVFLDSSLFAEDTECDAGDKPDLFK